MGGSRTRQQMDILSFQMEKWTAGQGQSQSVWWMEYTSTDFSPVPASCLHSSPNAGWPALMPSKQRPPMSTGLLSLPSVMLPHSTPGTKSLPSHRRLQSTDGHCSATAPQCSKNTFHCALEADLIYSAWLWITQTHFISSLPQCMLHSNSLKMVVNACGIFRTALYGWCVLLQHMSCLSIT